MSVIVDSVLPTIISILNKYANRNTPRYFDLPDGIFNPYHWS